MNFDINNTKIKCYDCHTDTVEFNPKLEGHQVCICTICGTGYSIRVYGEERLVISGKVKGDIKNV